MQPLRGEAQRPGDDLAGGAFAQIDGEQIGRGLPAQLDGEGDHEDTASLMS